MYKGVRIQNQNKPSPPVGMKMKQSYRKPREDISEVQWMHVAKAKNLSYPLGHKPMETISWNIKEF